MLPLAVESCTVPEHAPTGGGVAGPATGVEVTTGGGVTGASVAGAATGVSVAAVEYEAEKPVLGTDPSEMKTTNSDWPVEDRAGGMTVPLYAPISEAADDEPSYLRNN